MADEKPRKSRREAMYDNKTSVAAREKKPAADRKALGAAAAPDGGPEMLKRHENERRDIHGRQRGEHRELDKAADADLPHKKVAAHHRHRQEFDQMHERHEKELIDKLAAMHKEAA